MATCHARGMSRGERQYNLDGLEDRRYLNEELVEKELLRQAGDSPLLGTWPCGKLRWQMPFKEAKGFHTFRSSGGSERATVVLPVPSILSEECPQESPRSRASTRAVPGWR